MKNFGNLLDNIEVLTEEAKTSIKEAFEQAVETRANERVQLQVESALAKIDEQHAKQLTKLLEKVDEDHSRKFAIALQKIDEDHTQKLRNIVEHYEKALKKESLAFRKELEEDISEFLDVYIENAIPTQEIRKAVENKQAATLLESIRQLVAVDERYITNNIKEALKDGKDKMIEYQKKLNEQVKENIDLTKKMKGLEAKLLLQEKTIDMPRAKKQYVYKLLENKSPDYIQNNFKCVVEMFEKDSAAPLRLLKENKDKTLSSRPVASSVDTPPTLLEESGSEAQSKQSSPAAEYLKMLKSQEMR